MKQNTQDLSWTLNGTFGALQGARINDVLRAFTNQEFLDDCAAVRAERGDPDTGRWRTNRPDGTEIP